MVQYGAVRAETIEPSLQLPVVVNSPNVVYGPDNVIRARYEYTSCQVTRPSTAAGPLVASTVTNTYCFATNAKVPRLGLMLVGWGGNNGSTLTAALLANRRALSWETRRGRQDANYLGSLVMASTVKLGTDAENPAHEVYVPLRDMVPMVHPNDIVVGGWDINAADLATAMDRACVLEPDLRRQLRPDMASLSPLPSVYYPDFIAANQSSRANNVLPGADKGAHLVTLREDIRAFKAANAVDTVVLLWTANTERYADILPGVNNSADAILDAIKNSHSEIAPSTLFAVAASLEGAHFINGSPQNTLVPGVVELAERLGVFVGGDDFKSGQTKIKSVLVDFLVGAGIRPLAVTSYNHLGNNDGKNLSENAQFRSKEISKSSVVDDMVASNSLLFPNPATVHPDHTVVIKYVPSVGDSKRALDEYESEIFMGGRNTMSIITVCEDSLLAAPLMIDLAVLCELFSRVRLAKIPGGALAASSSSEALWKPVRLHSVLAPLSYMLKAPMVPTGTPVINSLARQRSAIEALLRALVGLPPNNEAALEWRSRAA